MGNAVVRQIVMLEDKGLEDLPREVYLQPACHWALANNKLHSLDGDLRSQLETLVSIDLHFNDFTQIPDGVFNLVFLKNLNFGTNSLQSVSPAIGQLIYLQTLDLGFNSLKTLPESFSGLFFLGDLRLDHNLFETLPELPTLERLQTVNLSYNFLTELPRLSSTLTSLDLTRNVISRSFFLFSFSVHLLLFSSLTNCQSLS